MYIIITRTHTHTYIYIYIYYRPCYIGAHLNKRADFLGCEKLLQFL